MDEKIVSGLTEEQWKERYITYIKRYSDIPSWQADEIADEAWTMTENETPEESAETELSYFID